MVVWNSNGPPCIILTRCFPPSLQVDPGAFAALQHCIFSGDFYACEQVPAGDESGYLINPLGGIAVDMAAPAG